MQGARSEEELRRELNKRKAAREARQAAGATKSEAEEVSEWEEYEKNWRKFYHDHGSRVVQGGHP